MPLSEKPEPKVTLRSNKNHRGDSYRLIHQGLFKVTKNDLVIHKDKTLQNAEVFYLNCF